MSKVPAPKAPSQSRAKGKGPVAPQPGSLGSRAATVKTTASSSQAVKHPTPRTSPAPTGSKNTFS